MGSDGERVSLTEAQLMAIDLSQYGELVAYPSSNGIDWDVERQKVLFLQTAVHLGFDFQTVVDFTRPYFGESLRAPSEPVVKPLEIPPFLPPPFDVARRTPGQWGKQADREWKQHRDEIVRQITTQRQEHIHQGVLKEFARRRQDRGVSGQDKNAIAAEQTAYEWAALYFFGIGSWSEIASWYPLASVSKNPVEAAKAHRKRAEQIRKRVALILEELGLQMRK